MNNEFEDNVAFVTGAAGGMGLAAAKAFAEPGTRCNGIVHEGCANGSFGNREKFARKR